MERGGIILWYSFGRNLDNLVTVVDPTSVGVFRRLLRLAWLIWLCKALPHFGGSLSVTVTAFTEEDLKPATTSPPWWGFICSTDFGPVPPDQLAPHVWEWITCDGLFVFSPTSVGVSPVTGHSDSVGVHPP